MRSTLICHALGLSLGVMFALPAAAQYTPPDYSKTLTGDWGGLRTRLQDRGIDLTAGYVSEIATNPHGGTEEQTRYADQWSLTSRFDLQKLLGLNAASFQIAITDRNGRNLTDDADLHTLQSPQEVYGRGQTWRLTQFFYRQSWLEGGLDLKIGRMGVGDDFASFACDFQNLTFCGSQPGNVRGELWYSWPVSQWGTRVKLAINGETSVQLGVYQANPRYADDSYARHGGLYPNNPSGTTGALIPVEVAWKPTFASLQGSYKLGAWYDTSNANDVLLDVNRQPIVLTGAAPLQRNSRSGVYVNLQQQVSGSAGGRGATVFFNATQSDRATAASMDRQLALGVIYKGPFGALPADSIGLAIGSNHVNSRVAAGLQLANEANGTDVPTPGSETVGEVFYNWAPRPYFSLQPNLQYVRHPGGTAENESVFIVGLRTSVDF